MYGYRKINKQMRGVKLWSLPTDSFRRSLMGHQIVLQFPMWFSTRLIALPTHFFEHFVPQQMIVGQTISHHFFPLKFPQHEH
jgi:hypothetical protein